MPPFIPLPSPSSVEDHWLLPLSETVRGLLNGYYRVVPRPLIVFVIRDHTRDFLVRGRQTSWHPPSELRSRVSHSHLQTGSGFTACLVAQSVRVAGSTPPSCIADCGTIGLSVRSFPQGTLHYRRYLKQIHLYLQYHVPCGIDPCRVSL